MLHQSIAHSIWALMDLTLNLRLFVFACVRLCVSCRDGGPATSPSWIPSPLEFGSSCCWPTWLWAASSFWWRGKQTMLSPPHRCRSAENKKCIKTQGFVWGLFRRGCSFLLSLLAWCDSTVTEARSHAGGRSLASYWHLLVSKVIEMRAANHLESKETAGL